VGRTIVLLGEVYAGGICPGGEPVLLLQGGICKGGGKCSIPPACLLAFSARDDLIVKHRRN